MTTQPLDHTTDPGSETVSSSYDPIVFLSDFGIEDEFVGVVHGVIARIEPRLRVIDLNHLISPGNIRAAALTLTRAIQYLPAGVILGVVDPGVGTDRRPLVAVTDEWLFVGPDNGLFSPAIALVGGAKQIFELSTPEFRLPNPGGPTFHGRDIFAPAAAALAAGLASPSDLGEEIESGSAHPLMLPLPEIAEGSVVGEIWWADRFGNVQFNISPEDLTGAGLDSAEELWVKIGAVEKKVSRAETYGQVASGEPLLHTDSAGMMALAVRDGSAQTMWNTQEGTAVIIRAAAKFELHLQSQ